MPIHYTQVCMTPAQKKSHQSCIFGAIIDSLRYYQRYFLYFLQRRPNVPFDQKMDHDFPVINCTIISIHPNHENYSCQKLICAKVAFYTAPHFHIRDLNQIQSVLEVNMDQLLINNKKKVNPKSKTTKTI